LSDCSGMSAPAFALVSTNPAPSTAQCGQVGALTNRARGTRHRVHPDDATGFLPTVRTVPHIKIRKADTISAIALGIAISPVGAGVAQADPLPFPSPTRRRAGPT
jgi:hypothetical protein